jgi:hypothetical protein
MVLSDYTHDFSVCIENGKIAVRLTLVTISSPSPVSTQTSATPEVIEAKLEWSDIEDQNDDHESTATDPVPKLRESTANYPLP